MKINKNGRTYLPHALITYLPHALMATLLSTVFAAPGMAQVVPGSVAPGRIEQRFQQPTPTNEPQAPILPTVEVPQSPLTGRFAQTFTLRSVQIEDSTVYPTGTFDGLYKDKIGQTITLAQAREFARAITARYRTDGYVLSQAVIPKQDLNGGLLHIRVVEGFVDKVYVENGRPASDRRHLIDAIANKIRGIRPLNTRTLERYMLLIDDLPGVKARAVIKPSPTTFGAADLVVQVTNKPIEASFTSDNRGNKYIGPYQEQATLSENSLAGIDERTTVRYINTLPWSELHFFDVQHEEQLDTEGTRLIADVGVARTRPQHGLQELDLTGTSDDYSLSVTHPFLRSRATNLTGRVTFDARDTQSDALGVELGKDRVRAIRVGANYDTGDRFDGVDMVDLSVSQGVPWLDATSGAGTSRPDALDDFTKGNLDISRLQTLPANFSFLLAATGQYSPQALPLSEELSLGGVGFGQAYDAGEVSGDSGVAGRAELRYGKEPGWQFLDSYQFYGYYDVGVAYQNKLLAGEQNQFSLASTGAGVRLNFNPNLYGYLELGFPLTREVASEGNNDPRVFFSITGRY